MTNTELFSKAVEGKGLKMEFIAKELGITSQSLRNKVNNRTEFKASEHDTIKRVLGLKQGEFVSIFFSQSVD